MLQQPVPPRSEFFSNEFWKENTPRFVAFADSQIRRFIRHGVPKAGLEYVNETAMLLLSDRRHCPDYISPVKCVFWIIVKLILNDAELLRHKSAHVSLRTSRSNDESIDESVLIDSEVAMAEEAEAREILEKFLQHIPRKFHGYVAARLRGCAKARERAEALGVSIERVRYLDRTMRKLRPRWPGKMPPKNAESPLD